MEPVDPFNCMVAEENVVELPVRCAPNPAATAAEPRTRREAPTIPMT